jgi:sarcosine oxidase
MKNTFHSIVLGLGGIGSGALYWLSRRLGGDVLGLEQFEIGHVKGSSQDHSRIIRLSYHTPFYVELARHAYAAWADLEADAGEKLIIRAGGLDLSPAGAAIPIEDYTRSMDAAGVLYEMLDSKEVMYRFPQFRLTDDIRGLYQAEGGIAPAAKCIAAHLRMAQAHGAAVRDNAPVSTIRPVGAELEIAAGGDVYHARNLILCAGAWINHALAHFGRKLPITVTQEQVTYLAAPNLDEFAPGRFPVWIWMDEPCFYGFPVYGEPGTKIAQDVGGDEVSPETRDYKVNQAALGRCLAWMERYLPGGTGPILYTKTCRCPISPTCSLPTARRTASSSRPCLAASWLTWPSMARRRTTCRRSASRARFCWRKTRSGASWSDAMLHT